MATCNWCGNNVATIDTIKVGWGLKMRFYCSNRCKTYGEEAKEKSQGSSSKSGGFLSSLFNSDNKADERPSESEEKDDRFEF